MNRADSIPCPVCHAPEGQPCGTDDNDAPTFAALARRDNEKTTGLLAPYWHSERGDLANGVMRAR